MGKYGLYKTWLLSLCLLVTYIVCNPPPIIRNVVVGAPAVVNCSQNLQAGEKLIFMKGNLAVYIVNALSLDNPLSMPLSTRDSVTVLYGDIISSSVPTRSVLISLRINSVRRSDEEKYICQYVTENSTQLFTTELVILGPPYHIAITSGSAGMICDKQPTFNRNEYRTSHDHWICRVNVDLSYPFELEAGISSKPASNGTWSNGADGYRAEQLKIGVDRNDPHLNGSILHFSAHNEYGFYNVTVLILVQYKPKAPFIVERLVYPEEGKVVINECKFDAYPPATVFYVRRNGSQWERIPSRQDGMFIIDEVRLDRDIADYDCIGENSLGQAVGTFKLLGEPKDVSVTLDQVYGTNADLILRAFSVRPLHCNISLSSGIQEDDSWAIDIVIGYLPHQKIPYVVSPYTLENLDPLKSYLVKLVCKNEFGSSESSSLEITTVSSDVVKHTRPTIGSPSKVRSTDNGAAPPSYINACYWLLLLLTIVHA